MGATRLLHVTKRLLGLFAGLALAGAPVGCLYDSEDRCDDNQRYDEQREICVCAENAILLPFGCLTCPAGTVAVNNACVAP